MQEPSADGGWALSRERRRPLENRHFTGGKAIGRETQAHSLLLKDDPGGAIGRQSKNPLVDDPELLFETVVILAAVLL